MHLKNVLLRPTMSNTYFEFKQFRVEQESTPMKAGTDGVLLGAWFPVAPGMSVLDIGTGTGLIALMAAQRGAMSVTAVEINPDAAAEARLNAGNSRWNGIIHVVNSDIADFEPGCCFDRIVCNPPYFCNSLQGPNGGRNMARHTDSLSFDMLARCSFRLLSDSGVLSVVLPTDAAQSFQKQAQLAGFSLSGITHVVTVCGKAPKRTLMSFSKHYVPLESGTLIIRDSQGNETPEYINLVKEFYLKY